MHSYEIQGFGQDGVQVESADYWSDAETIEEADEAACKMAAFHGNRWRSRVELYRLPEMALVTKFPLVMFVPMTHILDELTPEEGEQMPNFDL